MIPQDLTDAEVTAIKEFYHSVGDPELRARLADVSWLRDRDHLAAQDAVIAYLESANRLENPDGWYLSYQRVERALQLALLLNNEKLVDEVVGQIERILERYKGEDPKFFSEKLMSLLVEVRRGDSDRYTEFAMKAARRAEDEKDFYRAERYWSIAARWRHLVGDADGERKFRELAAETFVKWADLVPNSALLAAAYLEKAIEAHRRLGNTARVGELHKRLIETQGKSISEMKTVSTEIDLTEFAPKAREAVKGKNLFDAILRLSSIARIPSVKELRGQVERTASETPVQHFLPKTVLSEAGKKVAHRPSGLSGVEVEREEAIQAEMHWQAAFHQQATAMGIIEPARNQILLEHNPRIDDLLPLLTHNPFVPPGREWLYAKGLCHGLHGDFTAAIHILVPQLENSFRYVLGQRGFVVSGLDQEGIQEEHDMNILLRMPEFAEIFGEDLTFDLEGLLVSRFGTNLRNREAHGLLDGAFFQTAPCIYLWWISLCLCSLPLASRSMKTTGSSESSSSN